MNLRNKALILTLIIINSCYFFMSLNAYGESNWSQFRGSKFNGVAPSQSISEDFSEKNRLIWKIATPTGHSSPIIWENKIFITGHDKKNFKSICFNRENGNVLWEQIRPISKIRIYDHVAGDPSNSTPATNGNTVIFYFDDYGLIATDLNGKLKWEYLVAPISNSFSYGASPIIFNNKVFINRDGGFDSSLLCIDLKTGKKIWSAKRPNFIPSFCSPYPIKQGNNNLILAGGSGKLIAYSAVNGEEIWSTVGLPSFVCPTPTESNGIVVFGGWTTAHVSGQSRVESVFNDNSNVSDQSKKDPVAFFNQFDVDNDKKLTLLEFPESRAKDAFNYIDTNRDGFVVMDEWAPLYTNKPNAPGRNVMLGISSNGKGDITQTNVLWELKKGLPYVASPLIYRNRVYLAAKGGFMTCVDLQTGKPLYQKERLGIGGEYYASPIAVDDNIIVCAHRGNVFLVKATKKMDIVHSTNLNEKIFATPAIADSKIYIRSEAHLWSFGD